MPYEGFAEISGDYAAIGALEQLNFEIQLEILDQLGCCGLRDLQLARSVLNAAEFPNRDHQAKLLELQTRNGAVDDAGMTGNHAEDLKTNGPRKLLSDRDGAHRRER